MTLLRLATLRILSPSDEQLLAELSGSSDEVFDFIDGEMSLAKTPVIRASDFETALKVVASDVKFGRAIFGVLKSVFSSRPELERDPGFWTWLSVRVFRDYSLHRWCGSFLLAESAPPPSSEMLSHLKFGSSSNLKSFTRNSIARLYIVFQAIDAVGITSERDVVGLGSTLLVSRTHQEIFERLIGLDAELVVLVARHLSKKRLAGVKLGQGDANSQRRFLKNLNLALGSVAIETLSLPEKQSLISGL